MTATIEKRKPAAIVMCPIPPLPGERRKSPSLVLATRMPRSKWWDIRCMGGAKKCAAGECRHLEAMRQTYRYMVPKPREEAAAA